MTASEDYYAVLGVGRGADDSAIRAAHRALVRKLHPDVNKAPDAAERFTKVQEAYDVLADQEKRRIYDRVGHANFVSGVRGAAGSGRPGARGPGSTSPAGMSASDLEDLFSQFFGGTGVEGFGHGIGTRPTRRRKAAQRGADAALDMTVPFDTALRGGARSLTVLAGGTEKTIDVRVPRGVEDGATLRLKGQGRPSPDKGGKPGDLLLTIRVAPHPLFRRRAGTLDIEMTLPLTIVEAALGATIQTPTPWGTATVTTPPGARSGAAIRLAGQGVRGVEAHGELYAVLQTVAPHELSDEDAAALRDVAQRLPSPRTGVGWGVGQPTVAAEEETP